MTRAAAVGLAVAGAAAVVLAACTTTPGVDVERSMASSGDLAPDAEASRPAPPSGTDDEPVPRPASTISWGTCAGYGIPDAETVGTDGWECGRLEVPMDHRKPDADLPPVTLALTRHLATGDRVGTIVMNPGGPGGAGLPVAWNLRPGMPTELLRSFDVVSWDPRGVGQSTPAITCPADAGPDDVDYIGRCVDATGPLAAFLAGPYSVADMESVRVALGEPELDFLGYSYGSLLGAGYAERYPDRVGVFVLDGVTDPDVGSPDGPFRDGFATFADDGLDAALDRFYELCAATERCLSDPDWPDPETLIDQVITSAQRLGTDQARSGPERLTSEMVEGYLYLSMGSASDWELLATAFADARRLDGSTLAAAISYYPELGGVPPVDPGPDDGSAPDNFDAANFLIYCADLGPLVTRWSFCDDMPAAADPLTPVAEVDVDVPILVIGTEYDPVTPGLHAPQFAERLGDATYMIWEGVGHTVFPGWTPCIDDAVADHFLRRSVPPWGTTCSFADGITDDEELADSLFGFDVVDGRPWLAGALDAQGRIRPTDDAECLVSSLVPLDAVDDRVVSHLILEVRSEEADRALVDARLAC